MQEFDLNSALHEVVNELLERQNQNALNLLTPPIDIDQPNEHNSKREFTLELDAVEGAIKHATALIDVFIASSDNADVEEMQNRLRLNIDRSARKTSKTEPSENLFDLVRKNTADAGLWAMGVFTIWDLRKALEYRKKELKDQEVEFWSLKNRAPKYYARIIALRLARLYALEKGKMPTYGTSRDGGYPSTEFGRAVERVFQILDIDAGIRGPVEWAISQLTDEDLKPPQTGLLGGLLSSEVRDYGEKTNAVVKALLKGQAT